MTATSAIVLAAAAPAAGLGGFASEMTTTLPFIVVMIGLFYFMIIRPQQRQVKQHQERIAGIKRGDTVVLNSGLIGKVVRVEDTELGVEIAQNVTVKVVKDRVQDVRSRGEPAAANDAKS